MHLGIPKALAHVTAWARQGAGAPGGYDESRESTTLAGFFVGRTDGPQVPKRPVRWEPLVDGSGFGYTENTSGGY
jgi:hypothetical protein